MASTPGEIIIKPYTEYLTQSLGAAHLGRAMRNAVALPTFDAYVFGEFITRTPKQRYGEGMLRSQAQVEAELQQGGGLFTIELRMREAAIIGGLAVKRSRLFLLGNFPPTPENLRDPQHYEPMFEEDVLTLHGWSSKGRDPQAEGLGIGMRQIRWLQAVGETVYAIAQHPTPPEINRLFDSAGLKPVAVANYAVSTPRFQNKGIPESDDLSTTSADMYAVPITSGEVPAITESRGGESPQPDSSPQLEIFIDKHVLYTNVS